MGNNAKKKVRSLPPLGKERSRGRRKTEVRVKERVVSVSRELCQAPAGLDVQLPDRQRLIGSPAPQWVMTGLSVDTVVLTSYLQVRDLSTAGRNKFKMEALSRVYRDDDMDSVLSKAWV